MHFFLGIGIANLDMTCRCVFRITFRRCCNAMYSIFPDPTSTHDNKIAREKFSFYDLAFL